MTGWRAVHAMVLAAGLDGVPASPKGLRHGFGVAAVTAGIPLNLVCAAEWNRKVAQGGLMPSAPQSG